MVVSQVSSASASLRVGAPFARVLMAPKRFVIIAFDSTQQAEAWYSSPAQKEVNAMVEKAGKVRSFIVDSTM